MAKPSDLAKVGFLYFIESADQNAIKIGFTDSVYARVKGLQTGNPSTLQLMGSVRCTYGAELVLHRLLKPWRTRLEWYPDDWRVGFLVNELLDEGLDRGVEWLAEHHPHSTDVALMEDAHSFAPPITESEMRDLVEAHLAECAATELAEAAASVI